MDSDSAYDEDSRFSDDEYRARKRKRVTRASTSKFKRSTTKRVVRMESPDPSPSLQPLLDALTAQYASEQSEDADFQTVIEPQLDDLLKVRRHYEEKAERDDDGRLIQLFSPLDQEDVIRNLELKRSGAGLSVMEAIVLRKLKLQSIRRAHALVCPALRPTTSGPLTALPTPRRDPHLKPQILDALYAIKTTPYESSFLSRLHGAHVSTPDLHQPVAVDWESQAPWMELMEDIRMHYALKFPTAELPDEVQAPITYTTLSAEHLPQIHDLLRRLFWAGIDVSDSLQYQPEQATIVALYKRLVVGCAFLSSPLETYITYLAVRPGWENAQIATSMLYHLITRNPNKDITLHVSANNPAMLLYNRFGFKAEEFVVGFYEDYLDRQSRASKNAFRLRLRR
ncbi:hypothetical protein EVG20_g559 [Dentipellis fragilis]|uniref:N-acetyltransferase domain-containing protein n=1 Tax=Dentipellis fragilis TaxID=205917 RepID=A0A4Y9ZE60_9AGAM|nr:hypothetical protein EVG20_g559 [Dentipellis fragilis]